MLVVSSIKIITKASWNNKTLSRLNTSKTVELNSWISLRNFGSLPISLIKEASVTVIQFKQNLQKLEARR